MSRLADLVHSFAASFPAVGKVSQHAAGAEVLGRLLSAPGFEDLRAMLLGEGEVANVELGSVLDELGDVQVSEPQGMLKGGMLRPTWASFQP